MKIVHKIILHIVILIFFVPFPCINAQDEAGSAYIDSLRDVLQQTETPSSRIPILKELANLYWQQPEEVACLKEVMGISMQQDSFSLVYVSMAGLCRYYFNAEQPDSLIYWKDKLDSLCRQRSEFPVSYYRVGNLLCMYYQGIKNYELAISEALNMLNEARQGQDGFGMMMANQSLGYAYLGIGRNKDAIVAYREGLSYLDSLGGNPGYELQYLSEMIIPYLYENFPEGAEQILDRYNKAYKSIAEVYEKKGIPYPVVWHEWLVDSYYAELYMKKGQLDRAKAFIEKAGLSADVSTEEDMKYQYYRIKSIYHFKVKNYNIALEALDKAISVDRQPTLLKLKIDILRADGRKAEAMSLYDDLFTLNSKISDEAFSRQIQQLRILNDLNDQEQQTFELQRQNEELVMRQQLLVIAMAVALLLLVLLYFLFRNYRHTSKLKNALQCEKNSLVKSEKQLRDAKEKAEEANRLKSTFISNISHEVRTPLNAIVGFSRLMADGTFPDEEKREFAEIISTNSELLLKLVNDVLDLSRLESGHVKLAISPCDLVVCCQEAIDDTLHAVFPDVKLTFTPAMDSYMLDTDVFRLKQVLINLLRNAAKFTKEGEINLSFGIDVENEQVRLSVTDTGCGIPVEKQLKIFGHFEKVNNFVQGTGLGLPICVKIVELLKGRLYLDTDYTGGARFVVIHPIGLLKKQ